MTSAVPPSLKIKKNFHCGFSSEWPSPSLLFLVLCRYGMGIATEVQSALETMHRGLQWKYGTFRGFLLLGGQ
jgi:hypothetical protein